MNKELFGIYEEDQEERRKINWDDKGEVERLNENDKERQRRVQEMIARDELKQGLDYHRAALIFQHGEIIEDYKTANELANKALELGDESVKWLIAATEDRWLLSEGKAQKYGTQFIQKKGGWELASPIDPSITDKDRAKYGVPALKDALRVYKEKYKIK